MPVSYIDIKRKSFAPGDVVFHEKEDADCAYLIEDGEVKIYTGEMEEVASLSRGEIFGEMAVIRGSTRSFSAFAAADTTVVIIDKDILLRKMDEADPMVATLIKSLVERLYTAVQDKIGLEQVDSLNDLS